MNTEVALKINDREKPKAKPVLKWAGGKGMLLPQIEQYLPAKLKSGGIQRYIEPFVGGGALFFELSNQGLFEEAYLFDINPELVILYNVIKKDVESLVGELSALKTLYDTSDDKNACYYLARKEYNTFDKNIDTTCYSSSFIRRAALTIFLNRTCFNGLYRVNSKGLFNVPAGRYKSLRILDEDNLRAVSLALQSAIILHADFSKTLEFVNAGTVVYYDPPYRPISASSFNSYAAHDFGDSEQRRLKRLFDEADSLGALQMLSNSDPTNYNHADNFFDDLYKEYNIYRIWAKRMINSDPKGRDGVRELLITNY